MFSKDVTAVITPAGRRIRVIATRRGGGGAQEEPVGGIREPFSISQSAWAEAIASTVDDLLDFDIVPPTELRINEKTGETFSVQQLVPNAFSLGSAIREGVDINRKDLMKIWLFDSTVGHTDRHSGNIVVTPSGRRVYAVDHETILMIPSFLIGAGKPPTIERIANNSAYDRIPLWDEEIPEDLRQKIRNVDEVDLRAAAAGMPKSAIDAMIQRKRIVERWTHMPSSLIRAHVG